MSARPLPRTLAVQLVQRLRDCDPNVTPALQRVEELLQSEGLTAEWVVREELQRQGADNVTVRNIVTSLVQLSALDWADIVEQLSVVDAVLGTQSDFNALDFATRNRYRSAIEDLARDSEYRETDVARAAIEAAERSACATAAAREPGYYLIGPGRDELEAQLNYRRPRGLALQRAVRRAGIAGYVAVIAHPEFRGALWRRATTARRAVGAARATARAGVPARSVDAIIALVNSAVTRLIKPEALPALDLGGVIPQEFRTLVAVPVLLSSRAEIEEAVASLERQYLASARGELYFALLADCSDAEAASHAGRRRAWSRPGARGIAELNARYGSGRAGERFLWLQRARRWNPRQQCWMGWERKRGKLHELNRLLRGARDTSFELTEAQHAALPGGVRYVLVLDADTQLPHGAAEKLIAKMSHPLNQPLFDARTQRVRVRATESCSRA